jgi:hypothetical protein
MPPPYDGQRERAIPTTCKPTAFKWVAAHTLAANRYRTHTITIVERQCVVVACGVLWVRCIKEAMTYLGCIRLDLGRRGKHVSTS